MRGISSLISTILILMIMISTVGFYFAFISRTTTNLGETAQQQAQNTLDNMYAEIKLDAYNNERNSVYVRNTGSVPISGAWLAVYVDGSPMRIAYEGKIEPDDVGEVMILDPLTEGGHALKATAGPRAKSSLYVETEPAIGGIEFGDGSLNVTVRFGVIPTSDIYVNVSVFNQTCYYPCFVASDLSVVSNVNTHVVRFLNINRTLHRGLYVVVNATRILSPKTVPVQPNGSSGIIYGTCWKDSFCNSANGENYINCPSDCSPPAPGATTTTVIFNTTTTVPTTTTTSTTSTTINTTTTVSAGYAYGYVINNTGSPVSNATVSIPSINKSSVTNSTGQYTITSITPGNYSITASASGYASNTTTIVITSGSGTSKNITISKTTTTTTTTSTTTTLWCSSFTLSPTSGAPNYAVTASVSNSTCKVCTSGCSGSNCTGTLVRTGSGTFNAPASSGNYTYYACPGTLSRSITVVTTTTTTTIWLSGFAKRKPIEINSTSNLTDYTVNFSVDTYSLISAGKMKPDCSDLRFTSSDGQTQLNYWIESGCNSSYTPIWINVTSIPLGTTTIYMYYGNPNASSTSSGEDTFIFFDGFDGSSIDTTKWNTSIVSGLGSFTASGSIGNISFTSTSGTPGHASLVSWKRFLTPLIIENRYALYTDRTTSQRRSIHKPTGLWLDNTNTIWHMNGCPYGGSYYYYSIGKGQNLYTGGGFMGYSTEIISGGSDIAGITPSYYRDTLHISSGSHMWHLNGILKGSSSDPMSVSTGNLVISVTTWDSQNSRIYMDWIAARKYASSEPVISIGTEQP